MNKTILGFFAATSLFLAGCSEKPPARKVTQFLEDRIALEAALTRCNADRAGTRDDEECINAREAAKRVSVIEEQERQRGLEAESQRKLDALRRRNAELEARVRRAEEEARRLEQERYEQQFAAPAAGASEELTSESAPQDYDSDARAGEPTADPGAVAGSEADPRATEADASGSSDLDRVREELQRRGAQPETQPEPQ